VPLHSSKAMLGDERTLDFGFFTLTGTHDASGRSIMYADPSKQDKTKYPRESMCRTLWYVLHAALENEMTQRRGVVVIAYPHNVKLGQFDRALTKLISKA